MPTTHTPVTFTFSFDNQGQPIVTITSPTSQQTVGGMNPFQTTHAPVMALMGVEMALLRTGWYEMTGGSVAIWFPDLTAKQNGLWINTLSSNGKTITENASGKKNWVTPTAHFRNILRITFAKTKRGTYQYIGVFELKQYNPQTQTTILTRKDNIVSIAIDTAITTI